MNKRVGRTVKMAQPVYFESWASIAGPKEAEGPWGKCFDRTLDDDMWGESSFEKAETKLFYETVRMAIEKGKLKLEDVQYLLGGDLLNQLIATSFAARQMDIPFIGLYGACSTMAESTSLGAMIIDGGFANRTVCCATSHFSTAERQFRFPLEMGAQRAPTAQRTVTGAGAVVLSGQYVPGHPMIKALTMGKVVDFGITDANNMGAAMAPSACDTILAFLRDMQMDPFELDTIITGDLGLFGLNILKDLMAKAGVPCESVLRDCGAEMFSEEQDTHQGASGCGCSAITLCGRLLPALMDGSLKKILFIPTGALMSTVSAMQGESIPSVSHAIYIERGE